MSLYRASRQSGCCRPCSKGELREAIPGNPHPPVLIAAHVPLFVLIPCRYGEVRELMLGGGDDGGELFCFVQFFRVQVGWCCPGEAALWAGAGGGASTQSHMLSYARGDVQCSTPITMAFI